MGDLAIDLLVTTLAMCLAILHSSPWVAWLLPQSKNSSKTHASVYSRIPRIHLRQLPKHWLCYSLSVSVSSSPLFLALLSLVSSKADHTAHLNLDVCILSHAFAPLSPSLSLLFRIFFHRKQVLRVPRRLKNCSTRDSMSQVNCKSEEEKRRRRKRNAFGVNHWVCADAGSHSQRWSSCFGLPVPLSWFLIHTIPSIATGVWNWNVL